MMPMIPLLPRYEVLDVLMSGSHLAYRNSYTPSFAIFERDGLFVHVVY